MSQDQDGLWLRRLQRNEFLAVAVTHLLLQRLFIPFLIPERLALPVGITQHQKLSKSGTATNPPDSEFYCSWIPHNLLARASLCAL